MQPVNFIFKHICYALIFTSLQVGCSGNIQKFGAKKEKRQRSWNNSGQKKMDCIDNAATPSCAICLKEYANNDNCINLPCSNIRTRVIHNFHQSCINQCIKHTEPSVCPVCRFPIPQDIVDKIKISTILYLVKAIEDEDVKKVQFFVQTNPSIVGEMHNFKTINGYPFYCTPLHYAVKCNNVSIVKALLKSKNISVNKEDQNKETPLHWAATRGHTAIVQELLKADGIDVNKQDEYGWTSFHWAAMNGHTDISQILLEVTGINANKQNSYGYTSLHWAAMNGHTAIVQALLKLTVTNVNKAAENRRTPLHLATIEGHTDILEMLLEVPGINVNKADENGDTPLHWAAIGGNTEVVQMLLDIDRINPNKVNIEGRTPLYLANSNGNKEVVKMLRPFQTDQMCRIL